MSREGYKMTELGEIPQEWIPETLGNCLNRIVGGGTPSRDNEHFYQGEIPWATVKDLDNKFYKDDTIEHITLDAIKNSASNLIPTGKIIVATRMGLGRGFINTADMAINQDLKALFPKDNIDTRYLLHWFLNQSKNIGSMGKGSTVKGIRLEELRALPIAIPTFAEQQKIADILSNVDQQIEQTYALIEKSKELKKGLMQKLLTKGIGHTEFRDTEIGRIPKGWEVMTLGTMGSTYNGLSGKTKDDFGKGKPFITYKNVFGNSKIDINGFEYVSIEDGENQNRVEYGDVLFTTSSETPEEVGMSSVMLDRVDELYLNSFCFGYRLFNLNMLIPEFAQYLFRGARIRKIMSVLGQGSTRYNISKNEVMKIKIPIPAIEEQIKIANILSAVDERIYKTCAIKQKLFESKKELMQKLLTGIIRVK